MFGNRFSASIVNAEMSRAQEKIRIFSLEIGVIYSSRVSLNCIYGGDGGTRSKPEDGCGHEFCESSRSRRDSWCDGKPHHTSHVGDVLEHMHEGNYNEVIISTKSIDDHLPSTVLAFFYLKGQLQAAWRAREVHRKFCTRYKLDAATFPLLRLDIHNLERPLLADDPGTAAEIGG